MENEAPVQSESLLVPGVFDAIHVVGLAYDKSREIAFGGLYAASRMQIGAAFILATKLEVADTLAISGVQDKTTDPKGTRLSSFYASEIQRHLQKKSQLQLPDIHIISEADTLSTLDLFLKKGTYDTGGDVMFILRQAERYHWGKVLCVAYKDHIPRLRLTYQELGNAHIMTNPNDTVKNRLNVGFVSSEEVLQTAYPHFKERFTKSLFLKTRKEIPEELHYPLATAGEIFSSEPAKVELIRKYPKLAIHAMMLAALVTRR